MSQILPASTYDPISKPLLHFQVFVTAAFYFQVPKSVSVREPSERETEPVEREREFKELAYTIMGLAGQA